MEHPTYLWRILGAGAGAILGFIFGNVPGAAIVNIERKVLNRPNLITIIGCISRKNSWSSERPQR